jgi:hypothetical protein
MQRTPVVQDIKALRRAQPCGERRFCGNTFGHGKAQCGQITAPQPYWARQCPTVFVGGYDSSATAAGCLGSGMTWRCIPSVMLRSTSQSLVDRIFTRYFVAPLPVAARWKPATGAAGAAARAAGGGGAGAAPNALDRRQWYAFKRVLLGKSAEKAQADQGVAGCNAVWGPVQTDAGMHTDGDGGTSGRHRGMEHAR